MESVVDKLEALVQKAESDLNYVSLRLDSHFSQQFSQQGTEQLNPIKLIDRLKKAKEEFKSLTSEAENICIEQKEIQSLTTACLLPSQNLLHNLQQKTGCQVAEKTAIEEFLLQHSNTGSSSSPDSSSWNREDMDQDDKENFQSHCNASNEDIEPTENRTELRKSMKEFIPLAKEEFDGVSELVKGRTKLDGVNKVHEVIYNHFKTKKKSSPLTVSDMTDMGLKITGATGQAKLKVLRSLKIIQITNKGAVKWQT